MVSVAAKVLELYHGSPELDAAGIAAHAGCGEAYVRAALQRAGLPSIADRHQRAIDQRDLDMLADLREGHSIRDTAKHWGVPYTYLQQLAKAAKEAA